MERENLKQLLNFLRAINLELEEFNELDSISKREVDQIFDEMLAEIESTEVRLV